MTYSRCLAAVIFFAVTSVAARANLFEMFISTRAYAVNGDGRVAFHPGNFRQFVDLASQNSGLNAKTLALVYDTETDAVEVVRKADGTLVSTVMTFLNGTECESTGKTYAFRQTFLALSGTTPINGSVDGPVRITYDSHANITSYNWYGEFQYSIPGDKDNLNRIVHGRFILGREIRKNAIP